MTDIEVILKALQKERDGLHEQIMQLDRIIKRVKTGTYSDEPRIVEPPKLQVSVAPVKKTPLPSGTVLKVQVLRAMDVLNVASSLSQIQAEFTAMTENKTNIRETLRSLQKSTLVKMVKAEAATRGFLWVKSEWIEDNRLLDEHKPEGFNILYKEESIIFE